MCGTGCSGSGLGVGLSRLRMYGAASHEHVLRVRRTQSWPDSHAAAVARGSIWYELDDEPTKAQVVTGTPGKDAPPWYEFNHRNTSCTE
eukprot:2237258-Prymnesium_polylepis.1